MGGSILKIIPAIIILLISLSGCLSQSAADDEYHPGIGTPKLSFSTSPSDLFGTVYVGATSEATLTINNYGSAQATNISGTTLSSPYSFKGGSFPGTGGSCESSLNPGLSCTIVVSFAPAIISAAATATLGVNYYNGAGSNAKSVQYALSATGSGGASGSLDTQTFGTDGKVTTNLGSTDDVIRALASESNGKIVAAGYYHNGSNYDFAVARYATNGSLDTSFGSDGIVTTAIGSGHDYAYAVAVQSDGKIIAAGTTYTSQTDLVLVRYTTDGSLDTSFDSDGIATASIGSGSTIRAIALQSDGKIVTVGGTANNFLVTRFNTNGSLDTTFDSDGYVTTDISSSDSGDALAFQSDGKIVVGGTTYGGGINYYFTALRYTTNGSLDTSFAGGAGYVQVDVYSGGDEYVKGIAVQSDGKVIVAGEDWTGGSTSTRFAMVRFLTDGNIDTSFDTDGIVSTSFGGSQASAQAISLQDNGMIILGGYAYVGQTAAFAAARYNTDGSLDTTFDSDGKMTAAIGSIYDDAYAMALQSDGKIVLAGRTNTGFLADIALTRIWP